MSPRTTPSRMGKEPAACEPPACLGDVPEMFEVIIRCRDEAHQRELYERFTAEGLSCRLAIL